MGPLIGFVIGVVWCAQRASLPDGAALAAGLVLLGVWRRFAPPPVAWCLQCGFAVLLGLGYAGWQACA